jgi:uncharacterized protein (DUF608 family)
MSVNSPRLKILIPCKSRLLFLVFPLMLALGPFSDVQAADDTLFPLNLEKARWVEFNAAGYEKPVTGVVYHPDTPVESGMPLGGIGTGCLDILVGGVLGFETLFNQFPRWPQHKIPFLGVAVNQQAHILAAPQFLKGGMQSSSYATVYRRPDFALPSQRETVAIEGGAKAARDIHYFGHYPVLDMEYEIDAPVSVGMRAWAPFVPGDVGASSIPTAVFEVRVRNQADAPQEITLAFSFPGIPAGPSRIRKEILEKMTAGPYYAVVGDLIPDFERLSIADPVRGLWIRGDNDMQYVLGALGADRVRTGKELSSDPWSWSQIASRLPDPSPQDSGGSVAVDFKLEAGETRTVRFVLAWHAKEWQGEKTIRYQNYYSARYPDALAVARRIAKDHEKLLSRIISWQSEIYSDRATPGWLADALINNLHMITEVSYWAAPRQPLPDIFFPDGLFAMNECPRGCPQIECIPCSWYGNMPIVYFFPQLARSTLRGYVYHMREDGAAPFHFAPIGTMGLLSPASYAYDVQKMLNGYCFVDMVHRYWLRTGDPNALEEFYPAVKKNLYFSMALNKGPDGIISFPTEGDKTEWWEGFEWNGMAAHAGGLKLSQAALARNMARAIGDTEFVKQCDEWLRQGSESMETKMWNEKAGSYYMFNDPDGTGKLGDKIMANQLDAEWANAFHGLPGVFRKDRVQRVLDTVKRSCLSHFGAVSFATPEGKPLVTYGIFVAEIMILGFTYMYQGHRETGLEILKNCMGNLIIKQRCPWDLPNCVSGGSEFSAPGEGVVVVAEGTGDGKKSYGNDYYQCMMLWAAPAALSNETLAGPSKRGGFVDRVIRAGRAGAAERRGEAMAIPARRIEGDAGSQ